MFLGAFVEAWKIRAHEWTPEKQKIAARALAMPGLDTGDVPLEILSAASAYEQIGKAKGSRVKAAAKMRSHAQRVEAAGGDAKWAWDVLENIMEIDLGLTIAPEFRRLGPEGGVRAAPQVGRQERPGAGRQMRLLEAIVESPPRNR